MAWSQIIALMTLSASLVVFVTWAVHALNAF
jgi:hypothetical protein